MAVLKVGNGLFRMTIDKALSIAKAGDTIQLAAGKYQINTQVSKALTFESERTESAVVLTGSLIINHTSCVFKNIEFECGVRDNNMIVAKQSHVMFEHCYFYGNETKLARAILLTGSSLTVYYCAFSRLSSNAIRANISSKVMVHNSIFKDLKDTSAIYLHSSQLDMKDSCFIDIATNSINAIGNCHIKAVDCEWEVTQAPALYLNPTVVADISHSVFKGSSTAIFGQKAALILDGCEFRNLDGNVIGKAKPAAIINHLFKGMGHSSVIEIEDSKLDIKSSRFIDIPIHAIESIGRSEVIAQECLWHVNNMPVLYLHPTGSAQITNSVLKGSNAIICVQQAALTLIGCELIGIADNHAVRVKENGRLVVKDCMFRDVANFSAVKVENAFLDMSQSRFINIKSRPINITQNSQVTIEECHFDDISYDDAIFTEADSSITVTESYVNGKILKNTSLNQNKSTRLSEQVPENSRQSAHDCGDAWFSNNDTVEKLQANIERYLEGNEGKFNNQPNRRFGR